MARASTAADSRHEFLALLALAAAVWLGLALVPLGPGEAPLAGALGATLSEQLHRAAGVAAWLLPLELLLAALRLGLGRNAPLGWVTVAVSFALLLVTSALAHLALPLDRAGGIAGMILGEVAQSVVGKAGAFVLGSAVLLAIVMLRTQLSVVALVVLSARGSAWAGQQLGSQCRTLGHRGLQALRTRLAQRRTTPKASPPEPKTKAVKVRQPREAPTTTTTEATAPPTKPAAKIKAATAAPTVVSPGNVSSPPLTSQDDGSGFKLPPASLLEAAKARELEVDEAALQDQAERLVDKLAAYGVQGRVDEIHPGPVVTNFEFEPESGTKVAKIASLSDDLAMALAAQRVRIVAPIPGKARVGFELPNPERQMVALREVLETPEWGAQRGALPMALGKDIFGMPAYQDLARMPHLLVAGATGAGKSVGLNVMLVSMLMRKTPAEVRMLMIDPKVVELAVFDGIPHMLLPVVTDMKKAALALRWAVDEMERRYQRFAETGVRSIATYNQRVAEKLPYIVVVVDEFADLMMVAAKDVEGAVARLAQKARAAGIHVILATQRPSVDVITGMIKANFPTRIAFKVSQREDSKTILGRNGAEHLLGMGDMLMLPPGSSDLKRVHCAYVSEDEVAAVCDHLRAQGSPSYDESILEPREEDVLGEVSGDDPLFDRAVAVVADAGFCSISHVQRKLGVGYNKAANIVDQLEGAGIVGPASSKAGGRREVLVGSHA